MTTTATPFELDQLCQILEHQVIKAHASALVLQLEGNLQSAADLESQSRGYQEKLARARHWREGITTHDQHHPGERGSAATSRNRLQQLWKELTEPAQPTTEPRTGQPLATGPSTKTEPGAHCSDPTVSDVLRHLLEQQPPQLRPGPPDDTGRP